MFLFDANKLFKIAVEEELNFPKLIFFVLNILTFANWLNCLMFLYKYDRYSKSVIPLLILNGLYAPIYYNRVIIKKRPLRNKIRPESILKLEEETIEGNNN